MSHKSLFRSASHFANIGSWKAGRLKAESVRFFVDLKQSLCKTTEITINILKSKSWILQLYFLQAWCNHHAELMECAAALRDLKLFGRESRQFFITSWLLLHGNMGSIFARCYNKWPLRPQTKKSNRNFTVTGMSMSCLDRARTANLGTENLGRKIIRIHHWFTTQTATLAGDVQAGLWLPTRIIHPCLTDSLHYIVECLCNKEYWEFGGDGFLKQISMPHISFQSHLENISSPASNPWRLKPSFAAVIEEQSVYCNNSWRPQLRDQTLCFSAWDWSFFCSCNEGMGMMQQECRTGGAYCGSQGPQASGGEWMLGIPKRTRIS